MSAQPVAQRGPYAFYSPNNPSEQDRHVVSKPNQLYYGDNIDVLRGIDAGSVDLVYLDPPFKSNQDYNVLFAAKDGTGAAAQIQAFEDTWHWDPPAVTAFHNTVEEGGAVADALLAFKQLIGSNDMLAYLTMMAPRLKALRRVLKNTGSLYLHCDPTASHYLKLLLDAVFGPKQFRNEIIWRRTGAHGKLHRFGPIHDVILYYAASDEAKWMGSRRPYMKGHVEQHFVKDEKGYHTDYYGNVLTGFGRRGGESGKPWRGFDPSAKGRHWAIPGGLVEELNEDISGLSQHQKLDRLFEMGLIKIVEGQAWPMYEMYVDPKEGASTPDIWAFQPYTSGTVFGTTDGIDEDVRWLATRDPERLGYQTQKPVGLLERIIKASTDKNDLVLDPFCGCGTTVEAAQRLGRRWIGIDITIHSIALVEQRLRDVFKGNAVFETIGVPASIEEARELAARDKYQFQWWATYRLGARGEEKKKGSDKGIDGRIFFRTSGKDDYGLIIISVKGGALKASDVRDLRGVVARERAAIGVLVSLDKPTRQMRTEAATAGAFDTPWGKHPRIQLLTVDDMLAGRGIDYPRTAGINQTFKKARQVKKRKAPHPELFDSDEQ